MNWNALGAIADALAAVAVVASLLYLAVQVRQNTRQSRLGAQQVLVNELGNALQAQAQNRSLADLVLRGLQDVEALDAVDRLQFLSHISHILRLYEAVYFHHLEGTLDARIWKGFEGAIADVVSYPGMQAVLRMRRRHLSDAFAAYLTSLSTRQETLPIFGELGTSAGGAVKARLRRAAGYQGDALSLPVASVDSSVPFYEQRLGFRVVERRATPVKAAILERDGVRIGLVENGGDSSQDGSFFEVSDVDAIFEELKSRGLDVSAPEINRSEHGAFRAFFVVAPDGLCFMLGEPVP